MAYIEDESELIYFPFSEGLGFIAAGWLATDCDYTKGDVSPEFFRALCRLLVNPWSPPIASRGVHRCELCRFSGGASKYSFEGYSFSAIGSSELFVPFDNRVYVAPVSIAHYIDCHGYCPPPEFQQAVLECPEMRSVRYLKLILDGGVRDWIRRIESYHAKISR